jgi:hypothetical protein
MIVDYKTIGLEKNLLYEILATSLSIKNEYQITPNTASMGIRIMNNNLISIMPYPKTKTFQNINQIPIITLNFVDDIFLYALASLKSSNSLDISEKASNLIYDFQQVKSSTHLEDQLKPIKFGVDISIPFIKSSWAFIICEVKEKKKSFKEDHFEKLQITEFLMMPILIKKLRESYKLYNRAENLTLETIILATRFKVAVERNDQKLMAQIENKITENVETINKFSKNKQISKSLEYINQYIENLKY